MPANTKRAHARRVCEMPIMYTDSVTGKNHHAKIYNISPGGMYFESDHSLQPESEIYIKIINYAPEAPGTENYRTYRAKVKWCKKINKSVSYLYGIGIEHMIKSHMMNDKNLQGDTYSCDLCGTELPSGKILETDDFICLCASCFNYLRDLPEGQIKESIKDFLLGNVI